MFTIAAFYHFFDFPHFADTRAALKDAMVERSIYGSILIADEGINGTIGGSADAIDSYMAYLRDDIIHGAFNYKISQALTQPFKRAKVRLKKETISIGEEAVPGNSNYVEATDWNALIADPDTIVLDARNRYEIRLGHFKNATDPDTQHFKQLPDFVRMHLADAKHKKIATYCTGGIRCEKLGPWLASQGFGQVYQLRGGILKYLEEVPQAESSWQGECYVFDGRIAVGHGLKPTQTASMCSACGTPLQPEDREHPYYSEDVSCPYCHIHSPKP